MFNRKRKDFENRLHFMRQFSQYSAEENLHLWWDFIRGNDSVLAEISKLNKEQRERQYKM